MANNQNTNQNNNQDFFNELEAAIKHLKSLDAALNKSDTKLNDLGESIRKLYASVDSRKAERLNTLVKNLEAVIKIIDSLKTDNIKDLGVNIRELKTAIEDLNNIKIDNLKDLKDNIGEIKDSTKGLGEIKIDTANFEEISKVLDGVNERLEKFLVQCNGLSAVNLGKLKQLSISFEEDAILKDPKKRQEKRDKAYIENHRYRRYNDDQLDLIIKESELKLNQGVEILTAAKNRADAEMMKQLKSLAYTNIQDIPASVISSAFDTRDTSFASYRQLGEKAASNKVKRNRSGVVEASRGITNNRTLDNAQRKLDIAEARKALIANNPKNDALSNILSGILGVNGAALNDFAALIPGVKGQAARVKELKANEDVIKEKYATKNRELTNKEITEAQKIKNSGLSDDEIKTKLEKLGLDIHKERQKQTADYTQELIDNEEALGVASKGLASSLTNLLIGFKVLTMSVKALWTVSKNAAQSNTNMVSSLKSMGASVNEVNSDSIQFFTNELENSSQRIKTIGRNIGDAFGGAFAGWVTLADSILEGIEWITEKLAEIPEFFGLGLSADNKKASQYSTYVLEHIATRLDNGIDVNGVEVKVDKEVVYQSLASTFGQAKVQGFDNTSSAHLSSLISDMAASIVGNNTGTTYEAVSKQLTDAVFNGSNAASAYGIVIDDQILAGYAALEKELDIVNVQYTDAYKTSLRYQMAEEMLAKGNSEEMQNKIKQWKQLGDVMQTTTGQLFDFQEVQSIEAKDFTIPEIGKDGKVTVNTLDEINRGLAESCELMVHTASGMLTWQEAVVYVNGDLSRLKTYLNEVSGEMIYAADDYIPTLSKEEQKLWRELNNGLIAFAEYARHVGLSDQEIRDLARDVGFTEENIFDLNVVLDQLTKDGYTLNFNYSDITKAVEEAERLKKALDDDEDDPAKKELLKYTKNIQKYVNDGYKFSDGSTINDLDGDGNTAWWDPGDLWEYIFNEEKKATMGDFSNVAKFNNYGYLKVDPRNNPRYAYMYDSDLPYELTNLYDEGHYDGGISTKEHIARISEGNVREAIINLDSAQGINALSSALNIALGGNNQSGIHVENLIVRNEGINIAENNNQWRRVAERIDKELSILQLRGGNLNYGLK